MSVEQMIRMVQSRRLEPITVYYQGLSSEEKIAIFRYVDPEDSRTIFHIALSQEDDAIGRFFVEKLQELLDGNELTYEQRQHMLQNINRLADARGVAPLHIVSQALYGEMQYSSETSDPIGMDDETVGTETLADMMKDSIRGLCSLGGNLLVKSTDLQTSSLLWIVASDPQGFFVEIVEAGYLDEWLRGKGEHITTDNFMGYMEFPATLCGEPFEFPDTAKPGIIATLNTRRQQLSEHVNVVANSGSTGDVGVMQDGFELLQP